VIIDTRNGDARKLAKSNLVDAPGLHDGGESCVDEIGAGCHRHTVRASKVTVSKT